MGNFDQTFGFNQQKTSLSPYDQFLYNLKNSNFNLDGANGVNQNTNFDVNSPMSQTGKELRQQTNVNKNNLIPIDDENLPFMSQNKEINRLNNQADQNKDNKFLNEYFKLRAQQEQGNVNDGKANLAKIAQNAQTFYPDGFNGTYWDEVKPQSINQAYVMGVSPSDYTQQQQSSSSPAPQQPQQSSYEPGTIFYSNGGYWQVGNDGTHNYIGDQNPNAPQYGIGEEFTDENGNKWRVGRDGQHYYIGGPAQSNDTGSQQQSQVTSSGRPKDPIFESGTSGTEFTPIPDNTDTSGASDVAAQYPTNNQGYPEDPVVLLLRKLGLA